MRTTAARTRPRARARTLRARIAGLTVLSLVVSLLSATIPTAVASTPAPPAPHYLAPQVDSSISVETVASAQRYNSATASVSTTTPGDLLLAFVGSDSPTSGGQSSVVSGGGLTWTKLGADNKQLGDAEVWSARVTGVLTGAKITAKQNIACWDEALTVVAYKNATGTGNATTSDAPKGAPTGTLTTSQANSWVWAAGDDWLASIPRTPGPSQTVEHSATDKVGDTYWVQSTAAPTPAGGTPVTINDTAPTQDPYNYVLVEVLGRTVYAPTVTSVSPTSGPTSGTNTVLVTGTYLTGATEVDFGGTKVTSGISVAPDGNSLTVEAPPGTVGTVDVRVTTPVGQSPTVAADQYTYVAPPPTPYSGAQISLTPGSAGPNVPHTTQTLKATLTDRNNAPLAGLEVAFTVTGANAHSTSAPTNAQGVATFTYTGNNAGTDSVTAALNAGADTVTSSPSSVTWVAPTAPVAPVSMAPVQGNFFPEASSATTFVAKPGDTAAFAQTFPDIAFNPPAGVIANDHFPPSPTTHPFTDVTTDVDGDADGTIPAQGNGAQAGVGSLASFDAVLTTTLHVTQPGDLSYAVDSADGFLLGIGNGASRVNGDFVNPPAGNQSAFDAYPLVAAADQPSGGTTVTHPVTIHFPTAGDYPVEFDYFSTGGPQSSLVFSPSAAVASVPNTPPFNVYVGYEDTLRSSNDYTISPLPWYGSPNVTFEGDSSAQGPGADSGGVRFDNVTNAPVTIDKVTVDIPRPNGGAAQHYDQWPAGVVVQPGQTLILAENAGYASFDTSDIDSGTCGVVQQGLPPSINVTIGGVTSTYQDTGEVLNTGGFDLACIGNESQPWVRVGTTGPANPQLPPPRVGASGVWDPDTSAFILYGGYDAAQAGTYLGDTWAWQKGKWTAISSTATPPARAYAGGAYDKATKSFVLFGGYNTQTGTNYNDTWTFDGKTWTQQHPAHSPPLLSEASDRMAYDDATNTVVLLTSGNLGTGASDTWTWDGTDWTEHASATQPSPRWYPALSFDQDTNNLVLFGGSSGYQGTDLSDTWQWDGSNWSQLTPAAAPPARAAATMDYDPAAHGLVLFGSDHGATDTWLYSSGNWSRLSPTATPTGRGYAVSAYDPVDQTELIGFGGAGGSVGSPLGDLWYFSGGNWSTTLPAAAAPVLPPATSVAISPGLGQSAPAGQQQTLTVSVVGANGQPLADQPVLITITGPNPSTQTVTTDSNGVATFTDPAFNPGVDQISASAVVSGTTVVSNQVSETESAPAGPPPAIAGSQPADGAVVQAPIPVTANFTAPAGQSIASWSVTAQSSAPGSPSIPLASGNGAPPATLATLDPSTLANGQYNLTITATASGGGVQTQTTAISVGGTMKLGAYQATYHELTVPVGGLSMTVDRVYNSFDKSAGDFGTGWHVNVANFQVGTGRPLGEGGWQEYPESCSLFGLACNYGYAAQTVKHEVTVTWPDGHQEVWDLSPQGSEFAGFKTISPVFTPHSGTNTVDTLTEGSSLAFGDDGNLYNSLFADVSDGTLYDPTQFTLTARDGSVYQLDTTHGLLSETSASGASITIDGNGVHGSNGQSITFVRDPNNNNRITSIVGPADGVNGQNQHWTYGYNSAGELATVTDPTTTVNYSYDPTSGELLKSTDANNQPITTITYGPDGRVTSVANGNSPPTTVTTSAASRSQTITDPNGQLTTTQLYDTSGDLVEQDQTVGAKTLKTTYAYDAAGRQTKVTDPTGGTTSTVYDETPGSPTNGDELSETDPDGNTWSYGAYNENGEPSESVNPDGSVAQTVVFDSKSGLPASIDVPGLAPTTYAYNPNGTTASITDPAGRKISYTYDASGNRTGQSDSAGDKVQFTNDSSGRPLTETDQSGNETDYTYDGNGNITSVLTKGTSATETAAYNGFNEPTKVTDADGHSTSYTYDGSGNMLTRTDADGNVTSYGYNADGTLTTETTPTGTTHYTYDALGRLTEADNPAKQLTFAYDDAGHLLTQTSCAQQTTGQPCPTGSPTITNTVDAAGQVTSTTAPSGKTSYTYTPDEALATVTDPSGGVFVYGYDAQGRQSALTRPNQATDTETFNDINQPLNLTTTGPGGSTLAKGTNTLDSINGEITGMIDLAGANAYTYNANGTLASATHPSNTNLPNEAYTYDSAGNRITGPTGQTSTYDTANRLLTDGTNNYTWNGEGDLATKTNIATGAKTAYTWNADGLLLTATDTTSGGTVTSTITNTYDPFGRLATETANGATTSYLWDGQTLLSETTGSTTTSMVTEPAAGDEYAGIPLGSPASTLEVNSVTSPSWPQYNLHGDVTGATNGAGQLAGTAAEYSAFGTPSAATSQPLGFDGYLNTAGGLDYASGRYYDASTGTFLSPDPLPATNPYSFTGNSPVSYTDPSGREDLEEEAVADSEAASLAAEGDANMSVYYARNVSGQCYVGITNNFARRVAQHDGRFELIAQLEVNLTRGQARVVEQTVIEELGLGGKLGQTGKLLNKINSIAEGGPLWGLVVQETLSFVDIAAVLDVFSACP